MEKNKTVNLPPHPFYQLIPTHAHSLIPSPVHLRLIVEPEDEVREKLEEVLPQQHRHVKINVAYIHLAHVSSVAHVTHAHKLVDEVAAVASVLTGVGLALIHLLLTPTDTATQDTQRLPVIIYSKWTVRLLNYMDELGWNGCAVYLHETKILFTTWKNEMI